jgi:hypothetical protein
MNNSKLAPRPLRIFVASPIYNDQCYGSYTKSLLDLQEALVQAGHSFTFQWTKSISIVANARNLLANVFMQDEAATHLLFVDSDIAFEASDVIRMLQYEHDVMAALYAKKAVNWNNVAQSARAHLDLPAERLQAAAGTFGTFYLLPGEQNIPIDVPFPLASAGTGLMLIRRNVFTKMTEAHPELLFRVDDGEAEYFPGIDYLPGLFNQMRSPEGRLWGEDISFCERWRSIGGQIHGCAWFKIRHLGTYEYISDIRTLAHLNLTVR